MTKFFAHPARGTVLSIAALMGLATACTVAADAIDTPTIACSVMIQADGNALTLEGLVQSDADLAGTYALSVEGPGTRIRQGGAFSAEAGEIAHLGRATLSGQAASLDAALEITTSAGRFSCPVVTPEA